MSSNAKKKKARREEQSKKVAEAAAVKNPVDIKRNILIIAVFVLLAAAATVCVNFIANRDSGDTPTTMPQTSTDASSVDLLPAEAYELVEYRDGKLPAVFVLLLNEAAAECEAANKEYGTALTIGDRKIPIPEFMIEYCDMYLITVNETNDTVAETGFNKVGFNVQKVPTEQEREGGGTWADAIAEKAAEQMQSTYAQFCAAVSSGVTFSKDEINELYNFYTSVSATANSKGQKADEFVSGIYGEGATYNMFASRDIMSAYAEKYVETLTEQGRNSCTMEEAQAMFDENPEKYLFADVRIGPLEAKEFDTSGADSIKNENDYLDFVYSINKEAYGEDYNSDNKTMHYAVSYDSINNMYGGEVAQWVFDDSRGEGDFALLKGAVYTCAVMILEPKHLTVSADYRTLFVPYNTQNKTAQSSEEIDAAYKTAKGYYDTWEKGDKTEESFAVLCNTYSSDSESNTNGGLKSAARVGDQEFAVEKWCFDKSRASGDCEIIKTQYGVEIVYFLHLNPDDFDWIDACRQEKGIAKVDEAQEKLLAEYKYNFDAKRKKTIYKRGDEFATVKIEEATTAA